jgi:nucleotide-binding universal stress UspA family protein
MEIQKILWPTDFSGSAKQALNYVTSLTQKYGAEIHILFVIEDLSGHKDWYGEFEQAHVDKLIEWENKKAGERLDQICSHHLEGCPLYFKHIAVGDPAQEILKLADTEGVDMIVMSTRGARGRFRFGGVAEKVVRNASVPVVAVPATGEPVESA